jgi:hypothetical protein
MIITGKTRNTRRKPFPITFFHITPTRIGLAMKQGLLDQSGHDGNDMRMTKIPFLYLALSTNNLNVR